MQNWIEKETIEQNKKLPQKWDFVEQKREHILNVLEQFEKSDL